jgi:hypothetical protein
LLEVSKELWKKPYTNSLDFGIIIAQKSKGVVVSRFLTVAI